MQVHVQRTLGAFDSFDIWFVRSNPVEGDRHVAVLEPSQVDGKPAQLVWRPFKEEEIVTPTLRLNGYEAQMLRDGLDTHGPTTSNGLALAQDAIKVRDRLLTLVEKLTT